MTRAEAAQKAREMFGPDGWAWIEHPGIVGQVVCVIGVAREDGDKAIGRGISWEAAIKNALFCCTILARDGR